MTIRLSVSSFAIALLFSAGCWNEFSAERSENHSIPKQVASDLVDAEQEDAAENDARVFLTRGDDEYFTFSWLALRNVDGYIAEVNRRDVRRLRLKNSHRGRLTSSDEPELLRRIVAGCPNLEALFLSSWTFSTTDLNMLLKELPQLEELSLYSCVVVPDNGRSLDAPKSTPDETRSRIRKLAVAGGGGIDDAFMAQLLASTPVIEDLYFGGHFRENPPVVGKAWPLRKLKHLRKVGLGEYASEQLAGKFLEETSSIESLSLSGDRITGACWITPNAIQLKEFKLRRSPNVLREHLDALIHRASQLESLTLSEVVGATKVPLDLSTLTKLRELNVVDYRDKSALVVSSLNSLNRLESISIRGVAGEHYLGVDFSQLTNLKKLSLSTRSGSFDVIGNLPPSLESLRLSGFQTMAVTGPQVQGALSQLAGLRTVEMHDCGVPPGLLETISSSVETLELDRCRAGNSAIAAMLKRLGRLETLKLRWNSRVRRDPDAITGDGWDFKAQENLRHFDLSKCFYIRDDLIAKISQQLPLLETLKLAEQRHLTGHGWQLERMPNLKALDFYELPNLADVTMTRLPTSLESIRILKCEGITGNHWDLARLTSLKEILIESCDSLESLGQRLPDSLETLTVRGCRKLTCAQLDYSSFARLESLSFSECFEFNVDRLFAELPRYARSLQSLSLVGCRPPSTTHWNMAPLNDTLHVIWYEEAEPAYVGGLDKENGEMLQRDLPDCQILM